MKILTTWLLLAMSISLAAQPTILVGSVANEKGEPLPYVTLLAKNKADTTATYGDISNDEGRFNIELPTGEYQIQASFLGYQTALQEVVVTAPNTDIGVITLSEESQALAEVEVVASSITRQADGYTMQLLDSPLARGKSALETLALAPGVTTINGELKINGQAGTRLYVNNREMHLSATEIETYLTSLNGEDIERIEVIPQAGAAYDATAQGGVIRITLHKLREKGYAGSLQTGQKLYSEKGIYAPNYGATLSLNSGKLTLFSNLAFSLDQGMAQRIDEETTYHNTTLSTYTINSNELTSDDIGGSGEVNATYNLAPAHLIGGRLYYGLNESVSYTNGTTLRVEGVDSVASLTSQEAPSDFYILAATLDYNWAIDSLGSTLRLSGDYKQNRAYSNTNFLAQLSTDATSISGFDNRFESLGSLIAANLDYTKVFSPQSKFTAGAKYYAMNTENELLYNTLTDNVWSSDEESNDHFVYTEQVIAAYVTYNYKWERWSLSAGVRGEYTQLEVASQLPDERLEDSYFNLFPTLNALYMQNPEKGHSLSLTANQRFERPSFDALRPYMLPTSEYSFIVGNPQLTPSVSSKIEVTQTLFQRYNLSLSYNHQQDPIVQQIYTDLDEPGVIYYKNFNLEAMQSAILSLYAPIAIAKWWDVMIYANALWKEQCYQNSLLEMIEDDYWSGVASVQSSIRLPHNLQLSLSGFAFTPFYQGNLHVSSQYGTWASLSQTLLDNRLVLTLFADFPIYSYSVLTTDDAGYTNQTTSHAYLRALGIKVRYNFNKGRLKQAPKSSSTSDYMDRL